MALITINIRNMCCRHCVLAVKKVFDRIGVRYNKVTLGSATLHSGKQPKDALINRALKEEGFELVRSQEEAITDKIRLAIHALFIDQELDSLSGLNLRNYLEKQLGLPYKKLSAAFRSNEQTTIERYYIVHRIEKAKALVAETGYSFSEISYKLGYSALSHLSRQFKEIVGLSMHDYKRSKAKKRKYFNTLK